MSFPFLAVHYSSYKASLPKVWATPFCLWSNIDRFKSKKLEFAYTPLLGPLSPLSLLSYLFKPQVFPRHAHPALPIFQACRTLTSCLGPSPYHENAVPTGFL